MTQKVVEKKLELIAYLNELGFTTSLDFEQDIQGTMFADVHNGQPTQILNNGKAYLNLDNIEISLDYVYSPSAFKAVKQAILTLSEDFIIKENQMNDNIGHIVLKGNRSY